MFTTCAFAALPLIARGDKGRISNEGNYSHGSLFGRGASFAAKHKLPGMKQ